MTTDIAAVLARLKQDSQLTLKRLSELLSIPSVSTDPAFKPDVTRAARWVTDALRECGLDVTMHETAGHPIIVAHSKPGAAPADTPHVLFYGHYDVQPPDPLEPWITGPFEPQIRDGSIYARGASDDKGQVLCFIEALRAWHVTTGKLPCRVSVLIEGEEECGSVQLQPFVEKHREELKADFVLISDTTMWDEKTIGITYGLRGLAYFDVKLFGPSRDLHSGMYGGILANPATMITQVLGRLFDDQHRITIPGFYDDVMPVTDDERKRWKALNFDETKTLGDIGVTQPWGEAGYDTLERKWVRPACDINGIYGGYMGHGAKTVIPSFAGAKVSFRLAPRQDPRKIAKAFHAWLHAQNVHGCRWEITDHGYADPVVVAEDSPYMQAARRACETSSGRSPVLVRDGATIPVVADFKRLLGIDSLLVGFGLEGDCIHSPNEHFGIDRFHLGSRTHALLLAELAKR